MSSGSRQLPSFPASPARHGHQGAKAAPGSPSARRTRRPKCRVHGTSWRPAPSARCRPAMNTSTSGRAGTVPAAARAGRATTEPGSGAGPAFQPDGAPMPSDWPLQSHLDLGALPTAPGCARLHARHVLWEWGLEPLSETVELLVSEIVTNAIRAARELVAGRFGGQRPAEIPS